ncbi:hypothetical protein [Tumebacillus flagellatus]|uniref:Uncharacterized protein n=1 Tax=Tumebacillus flagellatus TaxID=1157490 RepID=A0A074LU09_9BACL|nr:hypothetical protein [Tumebacillus flagellatus]KEO83353.1 hypothetical protein EL26_10270 [Tumebacillus flagellatus]
MQKWEAHAQELQVICRTMSGVHRWINGKVLLREILYERMVGRLPAYSRKKKPKQEFALELALIAKDNPPRELLRILKKFEIAIL